MPGIFVVVWVKPMQILQNIWCENTPVTFNYQIHKKKQSSTKNFHFYSCGATRYTKLCLVRQLSDAENQLSWKNILATIINVLRSQWYQCFPYLPLEIGSNQPEQGQRQVKKNCRVTFYFHQQMGYWQRTCWVLSPSLTAIRLTLVVVKLCEVCDFLLLWNQTQKAFSVAHLQLRKPRQSNDNDNQTIATYRKPINTPV